MKAAGDPSRLSKRASRSEKSMNAGLILILVILGTVSCFAIYNTFNLITYGSGSQNLSKQLMWFAIGFFCIYMIHKFSNEALIRMIPQMYIFLMICLLYLFFSRVLYTLTGYTLPLANVTNGAISWFQIPLFGSFQPSEFIKIVLIIQTSQLIVRYQDKYIKPTIKNDFELFFGILKLALPPLFLIYLQPDTGVCLIIVFTLLILLLCSGIRKGYIFLVIAIAAIVFGGFFYLYFYHTDILKQYIASYRLQRIEAWLNPDLYIRGSSNQLYTALLSLGSAGISGHGLQANIISIPEAHTDFIFAAFGQCFGLIGTTLILAVCLLLDLYLAVMAIRTRSRFYKYIIIGVIAMLFYQQAQNLGMIVGILPITGITLPLISYGGSSTLSYFLILGFIMNHKDDNKSFLRKAKRKKIFQTN